jgi:uncharacterized protein YpbB
MSLLVYVLPFKFYAKRDYLIMYARLTYTLWSTQHGLDLYELAFKSSLLKTSNIFFHILEVVLSSTTKNRENESI